MVMMSTKNVKEASRTLNSARLYSPEHKKLLARLEYLDKFADIYDDDGVIDPLGLGATTEAEPLNIDRVNVLHSTERRPVDRVMTFDIETAGLFPDKLGLACLYDPEGDPDNPYKFARHWHNVYHYERYRNKGAKHEVGEIKRDGNGDPIVKSVDIGAIEMLEDILLDLPTGKDVEPILIHCYAHNGIRFDWSGAARVITSNCEIDPAITQDKYFDHSEYLDDDGKLKFSRKEMEYRVPSVRKYLRKMLWAAGQDASTSSLIRRRKLKKISKKTIRSKRSSRGKSVRLKWSLLPCGSDYYIQIEYGHHKLRLIDSTKHFPVSLRSLGAKGETPLANTNPEEWLKNEIEAGRLNVDGLDDRAKARAAWRHWHEHSVTDETYTYIKQDCKILYDALMQYRESYGSIVKHPVTNRPVDPLAFLTSSQSSLTAMIIMSGNVKEGQTNNYLTAYFPQNNASPYGPDQMSRQTMVNDPKRISTIMSTPDLVYRQVPFFPKNATSVCAGGWYQFGKYNARYRHATFGGRNEVFQPMTSKGKRRLSIDKNSMYPSMMANNEISYPDPRYLRDLKAPIKGKKAILEHLSKFGGIYQIRSTPPVNPVIRDRFPVFPIRLMGSDYDNRVAFASWKGQLRLVVTGEELKHFLENTDVEQDLIEIEPGVTCYSTLVPCNKTPFYHFAGAFYRMRRESAREDEVLRQKATKARESGDEEKAQSLENQADIYKSRSQMAKLILNAGGYGALMQVNRKSIYLSEDDAEGNLVKLTSLQSISKEWNGWDRMTKEGIRQKGAPEGMGKTFPFNSPEAVKLAEEWAIAHYCDKSRRDVTRPGYSGVIQRIEIKMPSQLAPHGIRAFGAAMTAHARVDLHRALMAIDAIPGFGVLYCDTDSVHFEVPHHISDDEVTSLLEKARVRVDGKPKQAISIGVDLGQWKIEPVNPNPSLIPKGDDSVDLDNVLGIYLAPKLYYVVSQPLKGVSGAEYHKVIKDVAKGIPSYSTPMRVAMKSFFVQTARLGDPRGVAVESKVQSDLVDSIESGQYLRRSYHAMDEMSTPIVLEQPAETPFQKRARVRYEATKEDIGLRSWVEYLNQVQRTALRQADGTGIREALSYYLNHCRAMDHYVREVRDIVEKESQKFNLSIWDYADKSGMIDANRIRDNLNKTFLVDRNDPKDQIGEAFGNNLE